MLPVRPASTLDQATSPTSMAAQVLAGSVASASSCACATLQAMPMLPVRQLHLPTFCGLCPSSSSHMDRCAGAIVAQTCSVEHAGRGTQKLGRGPSVAASAWGPHRMAANATRTRLARFICSTTYLCNVFQDLTSLQDCPTRVQCSDEQDWAHVACRMRAWLVLWVGASTLTALPAWRQVSSFSSQAAGKHVSAICVHSAH
jgi:hypothetical protein